jgi:hypothetical protein
VLDLLLPFFEQDLFEATHWTWTSGVFRWYYLKKLIQMRDKLSRVTDVPNPLVREPLKQKDKDHQGNQTPAQNRKLRDLKRVADGPGTAPGGPQEGQVQLLDMQADLYDQYRSSPYTYQACLFARWSQGAFPSYGSIWNSLLCEAFR